MSQIRYPHAATKQLEDLEPLNAPPLHERIYTELLTKGLDFCPDREAEFADSIALLGKLMQISRDYAAEAGPFGDLFGEYLECNGQTNFRAGQFFTPIEMVDLTLKINLHGQDLGGRPLFLSDPAAGTGRFMLRTAKHFAEENGGALNFLFVTVDSDRRMFTYCTMNAILNRIPAICIHGDALTVEAWEAFGVVDDGMTVRWERVRLDVAKDLIVAGKQGQQPVVAATRFPGVRTEG
ncbi:MAG TPA: N-6 DNA methylase [Methanoculleus sp.]|nr:N-6 DNA methylase [Methanoculleus sp.]